MHTCYWEDNQIGVAKGTTFTSKAAQIGNLHVASANKVNPPRPSQQAGMMLSNWRKATDIKVGAQQRGDGPWPRTELPGLCAGSEGLLVYKDFGRKGGGIMSCDRKWFQSRKLWQEMCQRWEVSLQGPPASSSHTCAASCSPSFKWKQFTTKFKTKFAKFRVY